VVFRLCSGGGLLLGLLWGIHHDNGKPSHVSACDTSRLAHHSMSDLFHEEIPDAYIEQVFEVMGQAHWHTFQILTKRHKRLAELSPSLASRTVRGGVPSQARPMVICSIDPAGSRRRRDLWPMTLPAQSTS